MLSISVRVCKSYNKPLTGRFQDTVWCISGKLFNESTTDSDGGESSPAYDGKSQINVRYLCVLTILDNF